MSYHIEINEYQRRLIMKALTSTDVNRFSQAQGSGDAFDTEAKELANGAARKAHERDKRATETRLRGWGGRTRTQKCRRKISLWKVARIPRIRAEFRPGRPLAFELQRRGYAARGWVLPEVPRAAGVSGVALIWAAGSVAATWVALTWAGSAALAWAGSVAATWAGSAAPAWAAGSAEAISPVVARLSVAALRVSMPRCAATSAAITFIAADASGLVAAMTTGATSTPITHRTAICMGTDVPRRPASRCAA